jgi:hypothetical protein
VTTSFGVEISMLAKCGHCGKPGTKVVQIEPSGGNYKQMAICCISCSAILGVRGFYDSGSMIKKQEAEIAKLQTAVAQLQYQNNQIGQALNEIARRLK